MRNAADKEQVQQAKDKQQRGRERELEDIRLVLGTPSGRRIFWRYLDECGVFRTSFTGNSTTFFNEGARNIGLKIMADINDADPAFLMTMTKESKIDL